jgi:hypothetical protein
VIRSALSDFYFNSLRLLGANVLWGAALIAVILLLVYVAPLLAIPAAVALALPTAGVFKLAALITRDQPASFGDSVDAGRRFAVPALAVGALIVGLVIVLGFNFFIGLMSAQPFWWIVGAFAGWGLLFLFTGTCAFWPLLLDPVREADPLRHRLELALAVIFHAPGRFLALMLIVAVVLVVSTIAFAALLSISVAFVALLLCRYVLPTADRLEGRATYAEPILG